MVSNATGIEVGLLAGTYPGRIGHYRRAKLREFGCRPYPMPFRRTKELIAFQRWVIQRHDKHKTWKEFWGDAGGQPRKLGPRRVSLPLFEDAP